MTKSITRLQITALAAAFSLMCMAGARAEPMSALDDCSDKCKSAWNSCMDGATTDAQRDACLAALKVCIAGCPE